MRPAANVCRRRTQRDYYYCARDSYVAALELRIEKLEKRLQRCSRVTCWLGVDGMNPTLFHSATGTDRRITATIRLHMSPESGSKTGELRVDPLVSDDLCYLYAVTCRSSLPPRRLCPSPRSINATTRDFEPAVAA